MTILGWLLILVYLFTDLQHIELLISAIILMIADSYNHGDDERGINNDDF